MRQLTDDSVMRQIATVKTTSSNEYKKLVSVGGAVVNHGEEGVARTETSTPKLEEVSIKLFPTDAYPKTTQEILDFSDVDILGWLSSEISDTFTETEETDLLTGDGIRHNGDPVLAWAIGNVVMGSDANTNIKPNKKKSANKIDPAIAGLMAFGTWQAEHEDFSFDMSEAHRQRPATFTGI